MKKLLSLALVIIMTASLMIAVGASGTNESQNGDLLGTVDFTKAFTDGRGSHWNKTNAVVSEDYFNFLSSGGCTDPVAILQKAGVDLTTMAPFEVAMDEFKATLEEFKSLCESK